MQMESLINASLVKSDLKRFWPLWLVYIVALVLLVVAPIYSVMLSQGHAVNALDYDTFLIDNLWFGARVACMPFGFAAALIVAVSLNGRLFDSVAATFYGAVPLRRNTLFVSNVVSGLIPLIVVPALAALALIPLSASFPDQVNLVAIGQWFAILVAVSFVMYAIALLACQLAGTRPVAVLLYVVLCFLAVCLEGALRLIIMSLAYGQMGWGLSFGWASAPYYLTVNGIWTDFGSSTGANWPVLIAYCVAGVVLIFVAYFLNARRPMESAGESVAYPQLRPVLKYMAGVSMALLFAGIACLYRWLSGDATYGVPGGIAHALLLFAGMAIGGLLGLVFAEAIMRKSTQQVFNRSWKGALVLALLAAVFVGGVSTDAFGLVNRVPDASRVVQADMRIDGQEAVSFADSQDIQEVCSLNQDVIARGNVRSDGDASYSNLTFSYTLKNGNVVDRTYAVYYATPEEGANPPESDGSQLLENALALANSDKGKKSRFSELLDESVAGSYVFTIEYDFEKDTSSRIEIPASREASFVKEALIPDLIDGPAGDIHAPWGWEGSGTEVDALVEVTDTDGAYYHGVWLDAEKTPRMIAWLKENYPQTVQ